ncbi:MAG TPA: amidohydrolase family protein [Acidimicrobiia bacterium]|nr:amidohydrolase family protein [Acidimicrobiia bacterium]
MADILIKGGLVVDGTGTPGRVRDVAIRDGRLVPVDELGGNPRVIDAAGLAVTPGFVDIHTHYDAQLSWDPTASPSPLHGVTTAIGGNCGFTLAPAGEQHAPYLMRMMARVEGMPLAALEAGLSWDWTSFQDWVSRLDGRVGVNTGFLIGHSAVRRVAMGDACHEPATDDQVAAMAAMVAEACADGALGFSTSTAPTHNDGDGDPVPSRGAVPDELVALAAAVRDVPGTTLECILAGSLNGFTEHEKDLLARMSLAGNRPVNWNVLGVSSLNPTGHETQLAASDDAADRGARVVALTLPHSMRIRLSFLSGFVLDGLPGWGPVMAQPVAERMTMLRDPGVRRRLKDGAASEEAGVLRGLADWRRLEIIEAFAPENARHEGRTIGDIVEEQGGGDAFDVLLDVVLADELRTGLRPGGMAETEADWKLRAEVWRDPRTVVGGSDAGAHLDMMCGAIYSTALLAHGVREFGVISLAEAVHQLSDVPARLYGLTGRGRIADGYAADVVVFDPATVGYEPERMRADLPGGAWRLYAEATGVHHVLVNGVTVVEDGRFEGVTPGTLLRAGRDTQTVTP